MLRNLAPLLAISFAATHNPVHARQAPATAQPDPDLRAAGRYAGLPFSDAEVAQLHSVVVENLLTFARLRTEVLPNDLEPAFAFSPLLAGIAVRPPRLDLEAPSVPEFRRPRDLEDLAYASIPELAALLRGRSVTSLELVEMFLARLARFDPVLHCVVNLTPERAREAARRADREIAAGQWRGLLHGIPFGAKDLFAARGAPTTWGSSIWREQALDRDAAAIRRLEDAGAVLVAKLALGELAYGDEWFGGRTRNPWDPSQGSSGSSAGSASAVVAGCVPFALGTETLGSIVSPARVCGATGLRPTFGRVSREGAMALSWTMDKVGTLARSAVDAAIVFAAIEGPSAGILDARDAAFAPGRARYLQGLRIGVPKGAFDGAKEQKSILDALKSMGCAIVEVDLPATRAGDLLTILTCEAATAFDAITRSGDDDKLVWQEDAAWPNTFRAAQLVPAVEYLRASRLRSRLQREMASVMEQVDLLVHPTWGSDALVVANLTGHPALAMPDGFDARGLPTGITFTGQLDGEQDLCAVGAAWQESTGFHRRHPTVDLTPPPPVPSVPSEPK
ncbi:MAG: amidase [Planctomycetota bacterium]|nr:amidase [Planctomycetota bacterium]